MLAGGIGVVGNESEGDGNESGGDGNESEGDGDSRVV